jgi:hypothetical protein
MAQLLTVTAQVIDLPQNVSGLDKARSALPTGVRSPSALLSRRNRPVPIYQLKKQQRYGFRLDGDQRETKLAKIN